jgi:hypothetical protein
MNVIGGEQPGELAADAACCADDDGELAVFLAHFSLLESRSAASARPATFMTSMTGACDKSNQPESRNDRSMSRRKGSVKALCCIAI